MSNVLESVKFVVGKSKHVRINQGKIVEFTKSFQHGNIPHWLSESPISFSHLNDEEKLNLLLIFNSISFCYWGDTKWTVKYKGEQYDGSWAMVASLLRAIENGKPILDTKYRSTISREEFQEILKGTIEIPLLDERLSFTKEVASFLLEKYNGSFVDFVQRANGDAMNLLELIVRTFPSFDDKAILNNEPVYFYKRAQLLVSDIYQLFGGEGYGNLANIDQLTACADYKLPQSLRTFEIISYDGSLAEKIDSLTPIPQDSQEEIEIRANTIWAVELMKQELEKLGKHIMSIGINDHLWLMGQDKSKHSKPYHRTLTTAY